MTAHGIINITACFGPLGGKGSPLFSLKRNGRSFGAFKRCNFKNRAIRQGLLPMARHQTQTFRRQGLIGCSTKILLRQGLAAGIIIFADLGMPGTRPFLHHMAQRKSRIGQIVKQCFQLWMKQRQPMLHALVTSGAGDGLIKRVRGVHAAKGFGIILAKVGDGLLLQQHFIGGVELESLQLLRRALCRRIKTSDALQRVSKEIQSHRLGGTRRKYVDQAPTHGKVAGVHHRAGAAIAIVGQENLQLVALHAGAGAGAETCILNHTARHDALQDCIDRGENKSLGFGFGQES